MVPRDTRTGYVLEQMILPSLTHVGYTYEAQYNIGSRLGGGRHVVDVLAEDGEGKPGADVGSHKLFHEPLQYKSSLCKIWQITVTRTMLF